MNRSRSRVGAAGVAAAWLLLASACLPRQSADQSEVGEGGSELADVGPRSCGAAPESAIATLQPSPALAQDGRCGVSLELDDGQLSVRAIPLLADGIVGVAAAVGELLATGPVPEACGPALERCELWGAHDELGPVLLAVVRGPESEVPVQVYIGWVADQKLGFAPAWYGLSSVADHTRVGPAWALAPFACDGALALLPAARLPEARVEDPSDAVQAAAGRWTIGADGPASAPSSADGCRPVFATLP